MGQGRNWLVADAMVPIRGEASWIHYIRAFHLPLGARITSARQYATTNAADFWDVNRPPIIQLRGRRIGMTDGALDVFELRPVFEGCRNERGPHRLGRIAMIQPELVDGLLRHPVHAVGGQLLSDRLRRSTGTYWSKERPISVIALPS